MSRYQFLTDAQVEQFLAQGHIVLRDAFDPTLAEAWKERAFVRLGYAPKNPATWMEGRIHMPAMERMSFSEFSPLAWNAACELLGGADRVNPSSSVSDAFIVNFHDGADRPWQPPSAQSPGWHKDGDFFRHFLDSPEQGLLTLVIWSDIRPQGGGTFVATDSVPVVARFLARHPEGLRPQDFNFRDLIAKCREFVEFTGRTGDIVLLHPYMLHASSQNHSGIPRFLTNPPINLREPMRFDRDNPDDFSPVEQAILRGLGLERLDYAPTGAREKIVPERVRRQQKMLEEETARLAQAAS